MDIERNPYYNHYLSAYLVLIYYVNEYILVIFVYELLVAAAAVRRAGERLADFVRNTKF